LRRPSPVARGEDVAGLAVHLTARLLEHAGDAVAASRTVRDPTAGWALTFTSVGTVALRGFEAPVEAFHVAHRPPRPGGL